MTYHLNLGLSILDTEEWDKTDMSWNIGDIRVIYWILMGYSWNIDEYPPVASNMAGWEILELAMEV